MSKLKKCDFMLNLGVFSVAHVCIVICNVYSQVDETDLVNRPIHFIECIDRFTGGYISK